MTSPTSADPGKQAPEAPLHELLERAASFHQAGRWADAEPLYRAVLRTHPDNPTANHNLGILCMQRGLPVAAAIPFFRVAWEADPSHSAHGLSYLRALVTAGAIEEAQRLQAEGARRGLRWPSVSSLLGAVNAQAGAADRAQRGTGGATAKLTQADFEALAGLFAKGDFPALEARARSLVERYPADGIAWKALGSAAARLGRQDEALAFMRKAASLLPRDAETHVNLGRMLVEVGLLVEAESAFRRAAGIQPDRPDIHVSVGEALLSLNRRDEAESAFRRALALRGDLPDALCGLARTLASSARANEAESLFNEALALRPDHLASIAGLGAILYEQRRLVEAEELCRRALAFAPEDFELHFALGTLLFTQTRFDEAEASYRKAISLRPDHLPSRSSLLFIMNYNVREPPARRIEEARAFGEAATRQARAPFGSWRCSPAPDRLRVGLVSGDLRNHPVGYAIEGALAASGAGRIDWIAYQTYPETDEMTARLRKLCSAWRSLAGLDDEAAARTIHDDAIHVLVDISGHTVNNRLPVFAWRPAPVQVSWLGYFATTGLAEMDYVLVDPVSAPPGLQPQFTERFWCLPETRLCFTPPDTPLIASDLPASRNGFVTFGCFQNPKKLTDEVLQAWSAILRHSAGSRLRLQNESISRPQFAQELKDRLARAGIDLGRVDFSGSVPRAEYFESFSKVDIVLDTFPYPGATTTCEALWMGVPTVTLAGETMAERQGASLLAATGLAEWVAETREEYVSKAVAWTSDLDRLRALRRSLRDRVQASPVFDSKRFARDLESALWGMWNSLPAMKEAERKHDREDR